MRFSSIANCIAVVAILGMLVGAATAQVPVTDGLQLHLDAGAGLTLDGANVTSWVDQSGSGNDAYASSGQEPIYIATDANLNNQPSLGFDGTNSLLKFSTQVMPDNFTEMTIFSVGQANIFGTGAFVIRTGNNNPLTQLDIQGNGSLRFILRDTAGKTLNANGSTSIVGQYGIYEGVLSISEDSLTQTAIGRFGGGGGYVSSGATLNPNMAAANYYVGGWDEHAGWNGTFAELLVYDRALTEVEQNDVAEYLSTKYAVTWDPLEEPVSPLLDERYGGVNPDNWDTFTAGTGILEMPLEVPYRHARWTLPDSLSPAGPTNSAAGVGVAVYTGAETAAEEWENVTASTFIRVGGDSVADTFTGLAARVQDADMTTGASGSFYGIYINPDDTGKIALIRQTGGILGTTDVLLEADLEMTDPVAGLAGKDLITKLSVSTTEDGDVQIDGVVATDEAFNNKLAELSFLDVSVDKILGSGSVGFFGLNSGDLPTATNWRNLQVYGIDGAITPAVPEPSTLVLLLTAVGGLLVWRRAG